MQMSSRAVFVFIEGKTDRYFYSRVCSAALAPNTYDLNTIQELPVAAPGKPGLVEWFEFLRGRDALCSEFKGKRSAAIFLADKDVDDVVGRQVESPHFVYTQL